MFRKTTRRIGDNANLLRKFPPMEGRIFAVDYSDDGKSSRQRAASMAAVPSVSTPVNSMPRSRKFS